MSTAETMPHVEVIRDAVPNLRVYQAPTTQELLDPSLPVEHYPGRHSRDVAAHSLILHTSGSTGPYTPTGASTGNFTKYLC
jgi:hypothetical protein